VEVEVHKLQMEQVLMVDQEVEEVEDQDLLVPVEQVIHHQQVHLKDFLVLVLQIM